MNSLKFLHATSALNRVKLEGFRRLSTEELKDSLRPDQPGALKTRQMEPYRTVTTGFRF